MVCSTAAQVSRRTAVNAVAVTTVSPPCVMATVQCCVERLVRAATACTSKAPSATAAQKFTVSDTGSPSKAGCCNTAFKTVAAVMPP